MFGMKRVGRSDSLLCSFCHKSQDVVAHLICSPNDLSRAYICNEWVHVCYSILEGYKADQPTLNSGKTFVYTLNPSSIVD